MDRFVCNTTEKNYTLVARSAGARGARTPGPPGTLDKRALLTACVVYVSESMMLTCSLGVA